PTPTPKAAAAKEAPKEPLFEKFLKGFYGTLDVSFDDVTKGINGLTAYQYSLSDPTNPFSAPIQGPPKAVQQVGRLGYLPALSTNKSQIGYRNTHKIGSSDFDFILQVETSLSITAAPGLRTDYTRQSNVVSGAIGLGDTWVGVQHNTWGKLKIGTAYSPYKKSTDAMNPFSGMLGDYAVIMGNSGGDNRVEFGTRLDHAIWFESKSYSGLTLNALVSPGQNRAYDSSLIPTGESSCAGGNIPGSGATPPSCNDGSWGTVYSASLNLQSGKAYFTGGYELHKRVNRTSDIPVYDPNDVADEQAVKGGIQYAFNKYTTISGIYETMNRFVPGYLKYQDERTRDGFYFSLNQVLSPKDSVAFGWA